MPCIPFKICGLTRSCDVQAALSAGASYLGFIIVPRTPRCLSRTQAQELFALPIPPGVQRVLVAGDLPLATVQEWIDALRPDIVQLHRGEPPEFAQALHGVQEIWRAFHLQTEADVQAAAAHPADAIVADTGKGGTGQVCDWHLAKLLSRRKRVVLAGGITPENARAAFEASGAFAVDCSSGVEESPGIKSAARLAQMGAHCHGKRSRERSWAWGSSPAPKSTTES